MQEPLQNKSVNSSNQIGLYIKQFIAGIGDSMSIIFAFCFAISVLYSKSENVVSIGAIATIILSCIMGIGSYLAAKTATQSLSAISPDEEKIIRSNILQKTIEQLKGLDLGEDLHQMASNAIAADETAWKSYLEQLDQPKEKPIKGHSFKSSIAALLAVVTGSAFAMTPWLFITDSSIAMHWALCICLPMFLIAGYLKSKVNGEPLLWGAIRQFLLGGAVAWGGYWIAIIFQQP